jgi:hypothetical protein
LAVGSSGFTPPSGWTLLETRSVGGDYERWVYWIRRGGSAPDLTVSWAGANNWEWTMCAWTGALSSGDPFESTAQNTVTSGTQPDPAAVTTATADTTVIVYGGSWRGFAAPAGAISGYTTAMNGTIGGDAGFAQAIAYKAVASAGVEDPGVMSNSASGSDSIDALTIVLASVATGGAVTGDAAVVITDDFAVAATGTHTPSSVTGTLAVTMDGDFAVVASGTSTAPGVSGTIAVDIAADFSVSATATHIPGGMALTTSGHHLVANGSPKFLLLDAGWVISAVLDRGEVDDYLTTRKAQGFDGIIWEMMESGDYGGTANAYGDEPFSTPYDLTTHNNAYWVHVDYILGALANRGMWSFGNALYNGYNNGTDGWAPYTTEAEATAHGTFIGTRYKSFPHHVNGNYGDWLPSPATLPNAYRAAVEAAGSTQLWTNHLSRNGGAGSTGTDAGDDPTLNTSYMGDTVVFQRVAGDWAISPTLATGLYEGQYEGSFPTSPTLVAHEVRRQLWHAACGGATYVCGGHHDVWQFLTGWDSVIDSDYGATAGHLPALWNSIRWYGLEPQASGALVTSGEGSGATYVSACKTSDGRLAVFYAPTSSSSSFTVALGSLVSTVRTRWYNPRSGAYSTAGSGTYTGAGGTSFTKPDSNDWALLVEEAVSGSIALVVTDDFVVAATGVSSGAGAISGTLAAEITSDFTISASASEGIPGSAAVAITNDFTVAALGALGIPSSIAMVVTDDFVVSATGSSLLGASGAMALDVTADFVVSATGAMSQPVTGTLAAVITNDFVVSGGGGGDRGHPATNGYPAPGVRFGAHPDRIP